VPRSATRSSGRRAGHPGAGFHPEQPANSLLTAQENLAQLTAPEAIANAKLAVTTAQTNVTNAQIALNNQLYWKNTALIQNYYANYVIAKANLDKAQTNYDNAHVGNISITPMRPRPTMRCISPSKPTTLPSFITACIRRRPPEPTEPGPGEPGSGNATLKSAQTYLAC